MKKTIQIFVLAVLCLFLSSAARAQTAALKIGDKVPDITINKIINYKSSSVKLSDFKGKLLILDFWATWCSSCIKKFPEMAALQKEFTGDLQVLLVNTRSTRDTENRIKDFINKRQNTDGTSFSLPTVVNDSLLAAFFPHKLIPHYAWIGPDGRVKAITSAGKVSRENISQQLSGKDVTITEKRDQDVSRPLFTTDDLPLDSTLHYSLFLKGKIEGLPGGTRFRKAGNTVRGRMMSNTPLLMMYRSVVRELYPALGSDQLILEVKDSTILIRDTSVMSSQSWNNKYLYTYERLVPIDQAGILYQLMLNDLNQFSGYHGRKENRVLNCLVLETSGQAALALPKNESREYIPLNDLITRLNNDPKIKFPVLNRSNLKGTTKLSISSVISDLPSLRNELKAYGLKLTEKEEDIPVFVISDIPQTNHTTN